MDQEIKKEFEDLTKIIKGGFDEVDKRFEKVEIRLERIDQRLDSLESRLAEIQSELEAIRFKLETLEKRVTEDTDAAAKDIINLKERVDALEEQIKQLWMSAGKV